MGIGHVADNKFIAVFVFCETQFDKYVTILISVLYVVIFSIVKFSFRWLKLDTGIDFS